MAVVKVDVRFSDNVAELKERIAAGTGAIEVLKQSVDRAAASLGGQGLFMQANKLTAAIDQVGGVTKLTSAEIDRHSTTIDKAIEKYKVMGITAPPAMVALSDSLNQARESSGGLMGYIDELGHSFVARVAEGMLLRDAIRELIEIGKEAITDASKFEDLSRATGLSTEAVQRFSYVGVEFGIQTEEMARGVEQLSAKLANGDANASKAVQMLGLSVKDLIKEGPEAAFLDVAAAVGRIEDPMVKGGVAADLFGGKLAKILLPALGDLKQKLAEVPQSAIISDANIKQAHEFDVGVQHLITTIKAYSLAAIEYAQNKAHQGPSTVPSGTGMPAAGGGQDVALLSDGATKTVLDNATLIQNRLDALRQQSIVPLTEAQKANIVELHTWGIAEKDIADLVGSNVVAVKIYVDQHTKAAAEAKKHAEEAAKLAKIIDDLNSANVALNATDQLVVITQHARGLSEDAIAKYIGVTTDQVKATIKADEERTKQATIFDEIRRSVEKTATAESLKEWDKRATAASAAAERIAKSIIDGAAEIRSVELKTADFLAQKTLTSTNYQVTKIWEVAHEQEAAFKGTEDQRAAFNRDTETLAQAQTDALYLDIKAIETNSIESLQQTADKAWTTYQFMMDHHDQFTDRVIRNAKRAAEESQAAADGTKTGWSRTYDALGDVANILGQIPGKFAEIGAVAAKTGQAIMKNLADGNLVGAVVAAVTGAITIINKLFHDVEEQVNPVRQAFVDLNGGLATLNVKAAGAGVTLTAMLNARTPEAYKKAIDDLNAAFKFQDDAMKTLDATVQKYGFTLEELPKQLGQQKLSEQFLTLYQDEKVLTAGGFAFDDVLKKQAGSFQTLITTAMKTGATIPEQMKPAIARLIELGLVTDQSGEKLTDIGQLTFAETLDAKFTTLIDTIQKLADAISRGLGTAITNLPGEKIIHIGYSYDPYAPPRRSDDNYAALGGLVTNHGVQYLGTGGSVLPFLPHGTDTVPAMLTPGEGVVNQTGMSTLGSSGLRALNRGDRSGGGQVVQFSTAALERRLDQLSAALLAESRRAPERTGIAVRDALLQARVGRR